MQASADVLGSKLAALCRCVRTLPPDEKVVVATSFNRLRGIAAAKLRAEGIPALVLAGSAAEMAATVAHFISEPAHGSRALVLRMVTDCAGLTLTRASHLFLLDPPLLPSVAAQLIGRITRQGQARPCYIYHVVSEGSVDERLIRMRDRLARGDVELFGGTAGGSGPAAAASGAEAD